MLRIGLVGRSARGDRSRARGALPRRATICMDARLVDAGRRPAAGSLGAISIGNEVGPHRRTLQYEKHPCQDEIA